MMSAPHYRIESNRPLLGRWLAVASDRPLVVKNRALAVSLAAKSFRTEHGQEIRVVHVPTGEIVFRKESDHRMRTEHEA